MARTIREIVAANIRELRIEAGLTQSELSKVANLTNVYISRIEHGSLNLTLDSLEQIARALNVSVSTLIHDAKPSGAKKQDSLAVSKSIRMTLRILENYLKELEK